MYWTSDISDQYLENVNRRRWRRGRRGYGGEDGVWVGVDGSRELQVQSYANFEEG